MNNFKLLVEALIKQNKTISSMESCTGGAFVNKITNIEGSSKVIKFSAVTYSNEFKIKMGIDRKIIDKYTVYSIEVSQEMSKKISNFTNSDYGIGVTGKLNRVDEDNPYGQDNKVFISIYDKQNNKLYNKEIIITKENRQANKDDITKEISNLLLKIVKKVK